MVFLTRIETNLLTLCLGNAINRQSQLSLAKATTHAFPLDTGNVMIASAGLWAPTIRHHRGKFYIICTNCTRGGEAFLTQNFYISTADIYSDQWSDPILFDFEGIDPSLFFDDDGSAFVQASWELTRSQQPSCTIKQFEIDIATGRALSEIKEIWGGHARYDTEGPHIYKKDGYYYLIVAEGGTFEHHMLSVGRSRNIWGPYESYEDNPILTSDGTSEYIQNAGHGELFQDDEGLWWAAVLAIRNGPGGRCPIGRETFLTPVTWPTGGWPKIEQPRMSFERRHVRRRSEWAVCHRNARIDDVHIRDAPLGNFSFPSDGVIELTASTNDLDACLGPITFMGKRQRDIGCSVSVSVVSPMAATNDGCDLIAGLCVYKDDHRHAGIYYNLCTSLIYTKFLDKSKGDPVVTTAHSQLRATRVFLRIVASEMAYEFQYRTRSNDSWSILSILDTINLTGRDFTGTILGISAYSSKVSAGAVIRFEGFEVVPTITRDDRKL